MQEFPWGREALKEINSKVEKSFIIEQTAVDSKSLRMTKQSFFFLPKIEGMLILLSLQLNLRRKR